MAARPPVPPELPLTDILGSLASDVLRVVAQPAELPLRVSDVVVFDPEDLEGITPGSIVLAVGFSPEGDDAEALLKRAARRDAAAVAYHTDQRMPEQLEKLAVDRGIAVLAVPPDVRWGHVYSLLRTAMTSTGQVHAAAESAVAIGDLFGLADAIAAAVGGPVTIEDPHWRVLAYANLDFAIDQTRRDTILGRIPPAEWREHLSEIGLLSALLSRDDIVRYEGPPGSDTAPRLVAPVRAGDELLGSLWVAEADSPLGPEAEQELAGAAKLAAVHLLSHRASADVKRQTRGAFVREVLEGWAPSRSRVGPLRTPGPFTVLAFSVDEPIEVNPERVLSVVSLQCESRHPDAMCAFVDDRIWSVLPAVGADERVAVLELAERVLERVRGSLGVAMRAGVGTTVPTIAEVPQSRRAAERALAVLARRAGAARVIHIDDARAQAVLLRLIDLAAEDEELMPGKLEKLYESDRERGTSYALTLRTYLDVLGDVRVAAKRLSVHPNTLRHRLRRLVEISGLDLEDPDERLVTELQLRMQ
jgi:hypothetical protein